MFIRPLLPWAVESPLLASPRRPTAPVLIPRTQTPSASRSHSYEVKAFTSICTPPLADYLISPSERPSPKVFTPSKPFLRTELISAPTPIALGGHRGMGENLLQSCGLPAYRENTVRSFLQAAQQGASFVEFDVQVTKDGVPVIWHDNFAVWREADGALHSRTIAEMTLQEFKQLAGKEQAVPSRDTALMRIFKDESGSYFPAATEWQCLVDDDLPTLAEVFDRIPEHVGFDIEVKMAVPDHVVVTPAAEVNRMVGGILQTLQNVPVGMSRAVVFSSFDPEVCTALRQRQQDFPVLFLSGGGTDWHCDSRRTSIPAAINFAADTELQGVVLNASAVQRAPHMVAAARGKGLVVLTYGLENDDLEWVKRQSQLGVTGAIVDDVKHVLPAFAAIAVGA